MLLTLELADEEILTRIQADLRAHGGLMVPLGGNTPPAQFTSTRVAVKCAGAELAVVEGQVVQVAPDGQAAVLINEGDKKRLLRPRAAQGATVPTDSGEPLWARISKMTKNEKRKLAKQGNAEARRLLLKDPDPGLHLQVLNNPAVTAAEIAALIKGGAAGVAFLKQVLARSDLMSQGAVVEALVLCPKTPLNDAAKLMARVPLDVARRIAKTGRARGPVVHAAKKRVTR